MFYCFIFFIMTKAWGVAPGKQPTLDIMLPEAQNAVGYVWKGLSSSFTVQLDPKNVRVLGGSTNLQLVNHNFTAEDVSNGILPELFEEANQWVQSHKATSKRVALLAIDKRMTTSMAAVVIRTLAMAKMTRFYIMVDDRRGVKAIRSNQKSPKGYSLDVQMYDDAQLDIQFYHHNLVSIKVDKLFRALHNFKEKPCYAIFTLQNEQSLQSMIQGADAMFSLTPNVAFNYPARLGHTAASMNSAASVPNPLSLRKGQMIPIIALTTVVHAKLESKKSCLKKSPVAEIESYPSNTNIEKSPEKEVSTSMQERTAGDRTVVVERGANNEAVAKANVMPASVQTGSISVGQGKILGALSKEKIDDVIKANLSQIQYCYQAQLLQNQSLKGNVWVKFVISNGGRVAKVAITKSSLQNKSVEKCIIQQFKNMLFPKPRGSFVIVSYPLGFSPS